MPRYTFELQDGERPVGDETGVWFADRERALDHAHDVARELMTARELQTRSWRLDVYEDGSKVEQIPFAHRGIEDVDRFLLWWEAEQAVDNARGQLRGCADKRRSTEIDQGAMCHEVPPVK